MFDTLAQRYVHAVETGNLGLRTRLEAELDAETAHDNHRLSHPDALQKAALWYARRGVAVFPCRPLDKRPATRAGFKDATTDLAQVREWWTENHAYNIGAPTGITFDVIDIDGPEGVASIYGGDLKLPAEIAHSLTSRTAGHHVFIAPTGRGNKAGFMPGVDYRGKGGYVILAPSVGANGRRYCWTKIPEAWT